MSDEMMTGWTIYDHPKDFPKHYVVRQWWVTDTGDVVFRMVGVVCESLEEARAHVPESTIRFPREPADDPVITETWL